MGFHSYSKSDEASSDCCSEASAELKLYQTFIFTIPILLTFFLLFLFYLCYLRRRRVDWRSLRMRASLRTTREELVHNDITRCELGLKKEHREMLPIIVFKESFSVKDTQCPVCLADYQADDRLQQIPACGHTFHMCCIDIWLATHSTCPLCRLSLLPSPKPSDRSSDSPEASHTLSSEENNAETTSQGLPWSG